MSKVPAFVELKSDGVQLIVSLTSGTPVVLHWGADLGISLEFEQLNLASQEAVPHADHDTEAMDFTGRWVKERQPQRREIQVGTWSREIREGRSGHDYTIVQLAMTKDAG